MREQLSDIAIEMVQLPEYKGESLAGDDGKETEKTGEEIIKHVHFLTFLTFLTFSVLKLCAFFFLFFHCF
jgi:hypothetical protein